MKLVNIASIFLFAFILIMSFVIADNYNFIEKLDLSVNQAMIGIQNSFLTGVAKAFALIFDTYSLLIISAVIVIFLFIRNYKKDAGFFAALMIADAGIIYVLKQAIARTRPLNSIISDSGFSFPSGHTTTAVVFFGLLCYLTLKSNKTKKFKTWIVVLSSLLVLLIGFSRIYANLHWFSDVLGGLLLGASILLFGISIKDIFIK